MKKVHDTSDWRSRWENHPANTRVGSMESFCQNHGYGPYTEETIPEFIEKELAHAVEEERKRIGEWAKSFYLDVAVIVCDCGEKYRDSDLSLRVDELKALLQDTEKKEV